MAGQTNSDGVKTTRPSDRFRLRSFIEQLSEIGEVEIIEKNVELIDIAPRLDGNPKAVLFRSVGPEGAELVGNVMGSRRRLAAAFGVGEQELLATVMKRLETPIAPIEVPQTDAPVQDLVLTGDDADLTRLPIHLQHALDGGPYISAGIDISLDVTGSRRNIGYRRLMMRGRKEAGIDLIAPSDMRVGYASFVEKKQPMPVAFVIGSHPADGIASVAMTPAQDEIALMGALRSAPVPLVKCRTNDLMVPADAEIVLEGFLDEHGWREAEGPYGEYLGYYGHVKMNPVFHLTAITMRRDALFQTATISGRALGQTDTAQLVSLRTELTMWGALQGAIREPLAVYCPGSTGGMHNVRVSMRQRYPGEVRNAIASIFASKADVKHVFIVDEDVNIFSDEQMDWALATRFQADRDLVIASGFRTIPLDPSLLGSNMGAKAGFDLTFPMGWQKNPAFSVPEAPTLANVSKTSVVAALQSGPKHFRELMEATGSRDGRDTAVELDEIRSSGRLSRTPEGLYQLREGA
ncbi:UbiD family decarboxylase [Bradyrhizobium sp. ma5]|uniref:UbiD family decarboxylase n=1 Tax=Bradyrhizobium sp. ma5 TaxID=3344828 RepID=UPI0035D423A4